MGTLRTATSLSWEGPDESNLFGGGLVPWIGIGDHILLQAREGATCKNLEF